MTEDEDRKFDVRTIERRIDQGDLTREEYEEYLEELPDVSDNAEELEAEFEEGVLEEEDGPEQLAEASSEMADEAEDAETSDDTEDDEEDDG